MKTPNPNNKHQDLIMRLGRLVGPKVAKSLGKDAGFAILVWADGRLNHVTTSRPELAEIMGTQLGHWARETVTAEDAALAAAKGKLQ